MSPAPGDELVPAADDVPRTEVVRANAEEDLPESLVARLAAEMATAWRRGERPLVEEFLTRRSDLPSCRAASTAR